MAFPFRILIVHHRKSTEELVERSFKKSGHEFDTHQINRPEDLDNSLSEFDPEIVVVNLELDEKKVRALLSKLETVDPDLPVIAIADENSVETALNLMTSGLADYVVETKPGRLVPMMVRELENYRQKKTTAKNFADSMQQYQSVIDSIERIVEERDKANADLKERVKEQECLYRISNLNEQVLSVEDLLETATGLLPAGWHYPSITEAEITFADERYHTSGFEETPWILECERSAGEYGKLQVRVAYLEERPELDEGPFLREERLLLESITDHLMLKIDQIKIRQELQETEQKLREIIENSTNLFYRHDLDGNITYLSPQSIDFLGYTPAEAQKKWTDFATDHPINKKGLESTEKAIESGKPQPPYELQLCKKDGELIWVSVQEAPVVKDGEVIGIVGSLTDITEQKLYGMKLEESLERYDRVAKATSDTIWDLDLVEDTNQYNQNIYKMFGYHKKQVDNVAEWWREKIHPDDRPEVFKRIDRVKSEQIDRFQLEYRFRCADGSYKDIYDRAFVVRNEEGEAVRIIGAMQDITDRKIREQKLNESLIEKEALLMELHHRVKNNMAVISSMLQLQAMDEDHEGVRQKLLDSIVRIRTMTTIHEINYQSKSFSKIKLESVLEQLVLNILETFQVSPKIEFSYRLEPVELNINQAIPFSLLLNEVVTNIVKHAYVDRDKGKVSIELHESDNQVFLQIDDDGIGLPEDFDRHSMSGSIGLKLIETLSIQLGADYSYQPIDSGTRFSLEFAKANIKGVGNAFLMDD